MSFSSDPEVTRAHGEYTPQVTEGKLKLSDFQKLFQQLLGLRSWRDGSVSKSICFVSMRT